MPPVSVELWSERNVPYAVIRRRLAERTDADCAAAVVIFNKLVGKKICVTIAAAADRERDALKILDGVEPTMRSLLVKGAPNLTPDLLDQLLELQALTVEAYVRTANKVYPQFPKQGRN